MAVTINGSTGIEYDDNVKLIMGTSDDLELYHSGSHSHIKDSGTGHLQVDGSRVQLRNIANDDPMVDCTGGGVVEIFYNGTKKLETHSNGVRVVNTGADAELRVLSPSGQNGRIELTADAGAANEDNFRLAVNTDQKFRLYGKPSGTYTEFLSVDQSGDVKITTGQLDINNSTANAVGDLDDPADYGLVLRGSSTTGEGTGIAFTNDDLSAVGSAICHIDNGSNNIGHLAFYTSASSNTPVEKMRIRSDGNILIGMQDFSSTPSASNHGISLHNTNNASVWAAGSATTNSHIIWANTNGTCGSIQTEGTGTSYNTSSDYRLKENIVGITDGITRLKQLAPKRFNFKTNASKILDGFLAHEVTPIVPEAISGEKDAVITQAMVDNKEYEEDRLGEILPQGIDQAKLVPLLTAALQEAITEIETLKTKVAALEAA